MKFSEIVRKVIELSLLARQQRSEQPREAPEMFYRMPPSDELQSFPSPPPAATELDKFLKEQSAAVIYALTFLMYAGRQDLPINGFMEWYEDVSNKFGKPAHAIGQMLAKAKLPEYLEKAMEFATVSDIDIDKLLKANG